MIRVEIRFADDVRPEVQTFEQYEGTARKWAKAMKRRADVARVYVEAACTNPECNEDWHDDSDGCGCGNEPCPMLLDDAGDCEKCASDLADESCGCGHFCSSCTGMGEAQF